MLKRVDNRVESDRFLRLSEIRFRVHKEAPDFRPGPVFLRLNVTYDTAF